MIWRCKIFEHTKFQFLTSILYLTWHHYMSFALIFVVITVTTITWFHFWGFLCIFCLLINCPIFISHISMVDCCFWQVSWKLSDLYSPLLCSDFVFHIESFSFPYGMSMLFEHSHQFYIPHSDFCFVTQQITLQNDWFWSFCQV